MEFLATKVMLRDLELRNRVFLAPLAGVSDVPFRRICQELGAGLTYVEMLSATAILYSNKRTFEMMSRHKSEGVLGVQVTGSSAEDVARAISILDTKGFETIDINMGCPVRKVVGAGCGSAILKDPERVSQTVKLARQATSRPMSAKFRLGYTRDAVNVSETARRVVTENVDMFTIHGRTRSENYSTPCDLKGIHTGIHSGRTQDEHQQNKQRPLAVGNGDVFDAASARRMVAETNCDAVMVSRGALGNPWVFAEILQGKTLNPTFEEWLEVVMRHLNYHQEFYGNTRVSAVLARKHLLWYSKGFPGVKALRDVFNNIESLDTARELLMQYAQKTDKSFVRNSGSVAAEQSTKLNSDYDPKYEMDRQLDRGVGDEGMTELS